MEGAAPCLLRREKTALSPLKFGLKKEEERLVIGTAQLNFPGSVWFCASSHLPGGGELTYLARKLVYWEGMKEKNEFTCSPSTTPLTPPQRLC